VHALQLLLCYALLTTTELKQCTGVPGEESQYGFLCTANARAPMSCYLRCCYYFSLC
jgi:hypothetical protein